MRLSADLNSFKSNHKKKKNQIIYSVKNCKDYTKVPLLLPTVAWCWWKVYCAMEGDAKSLIHDRLIAELYLGIQAREEVTA